MAQVKQLNVRVPEELATRIGRIARLRRQSMNEWVVRVLEESADRAYKKYRLAELERKLGKLAEEYLPGSVASVDEMLAMAETFAAEDTADGLQTRYVRKRGTKG